MTSFLLVLLAAADAGVATPPPKIAMHNAFDSLTTLVWLTATPPKPEQVADIDRELKVLETLPHSFQGTAAQKEPGLAAIGSLLSIYAGQTRARLATGDRSSANYRVRTIASLCLACHTREPVVADFGDTEKRFEQLGLPTLERARVLAATRQFDQALKTFRVVLDGPVTNPDYQRALEESLVILVRAKGDAKATVAFLDEVNKKVSVAAVNETALLKALGEWMADAQAWAAEKTNLDTAKADEAVKRSEALIAQNRDLPLLRASAALTRVLSQNPKLKNRGEVLWDLGVASSVLHSPLLWDLDLLYLEACVRENPKTPLAKKCLARFEEHLVLGFTGSSGTNLPPDEKARLDHLHRLAQ
ncbi:MAG: hypothetical protein U0228_27640 [Myxococcaceae bacterium]